MTFITILGGNGAGKSTLFNTLAGTLPLTSGQVLIKGEDVTHYGPEKRAKYLSRVFQDPKMGTAPRMTVAENLLIAKFRGEKRGLVPRRLAQYKDEFKRFEPDWQWFREACRYGGRILIWWTTSSSEPVDGYPEAS